MAPHPRARAGHHPRDRGRTEREQRAPRTEGLSVGRNVIVTAAGCKIIEGNTRLDVNLRQAHRPLLQDPGAGRFLESHGLVRPANRRVEGRSRHSS